MMADKSETPETQAPATSNPHPAVTSLTTPCTIQQLHNWLKDADILTNNYRHTAASVTSSGSAINII